MDFRTSETKDNLMRAFAGECQAYMRYTFAAAQAKKEKLQVIEQVFSYTANQEKAHAKVFYNHLTNLVGEEIQISGSYPVDISDKTVYLLRMAEHNEMKEYGDVYKSFADKAKDEGFSEIAASFYMIADIEKTHGERFGKFAGLLEDGTLLCARENETWICLNCGHVFEAANTPDKCPVCDHDKGYFIRLPMSPWE